MSKPRLRENALYSGDNGRIFCGKIHCAGQTAYYSGRDLSGLRALRIRTKDGWPTTTKCETCGLTLSKTGD